MGKGLFFKCFQEAELNVLMDDEKHNKVCSFVFIFQLILGLRNWKAKAGPIC